MDPVEFLRRHEPFSRLADEGLRDVGRALEVRYARRGEILLSRGGDPTTHLGVVRKGAVRLEVDGRPADVLVEGEPFGFPSLLTRGRPQFDVVALEDSLIYWLPARTFHLLVERHAAFGEFFLKTLADRLRLANEREIAPLAGDLTTPVIRLAAGPPVFVARDATVGEAARVMRDRRVGSVLVEGDPPGIVTDRDLRSRVLAASKGPDTPVQDVMSAPLKSFAADAPLYQAMLYLLSQRIHHLPLERDGALIGVVTHTDLLRHHVKSPSYLLKKIDKFQDEADLEGYAEEVAGMVEALTWSGLEAVEVGKIVASLNDAVVQGLLVRTERRLGPPPCAYAWIVFGSEGRGEQALITDQDNALVYEDDDPRAAEYFARLADAVVHGLIRASFPPCKGGFMATNWNRPLAEWRRLFEDWTSTPEPQALLEVANFFDYRKIHGELSLEPLETIVREAAGKRVFLAHLARASLGMRPPLGLFHRIREDDSGVDLKAGGLMPILGLARVHALEAGSAERSTLGRLEAAARAGTLSEEGAQTLAEGFRFLFRLRLASQLAAERRHELPDNRVHLEGLSALERRHLKETFQHVRTMQEAMSQRFAVGLLG